MVRELWNGPWGKCKYIYILKHSIDHSESHVQEGMSVPHHLEQN